MTRARVVIVFVTVALFTAALGIALGAGPLQDDMRDAFLRRPAEQQQGPEQQRRQTVLRQTVAYDTDAVTSIAPRVLSGSLEDRTVAVLTLPGADERQTDRAVSDVEAAGGHITTRMRVGADLIDPSARTLVDTLTAGQVDEYDALQVPPDADVYERVGAVLGRALLTETDGGEPLDDAASGVLSGFTTADLLSGPMPERRAGLVLVVAGGQHGEDVGDSGRGSILATLARSLATRSDGAVVAGPRPAAEEGGAVAAVRSDEAAAQEVSTIDTLDTRMGQVGAVLTLHERAAGTVGHYGAPGAPDGAMPE